VTPGGDLRPALRDALVAAASSERLLVAVDFDGTLAPIVAVPADARSLPGGLETLAQLAALPQTSAALVSGRARADLAALAPVSNDVRLVGSHGAEVDDVVLSPDDAERLIALLSDVRVIVDGIAGVTLENKPAGVAVHVRRAARDDAARVSDAVLAGPAQSPGVHVTHGKEVVELSVLVADKGTALDRLRTESGATAVVYLGDDVTDEAALRSLRADDVGVKVGDGDTVARHRIAGPADVVDVLQLLAAERARVVDASWDGVR
jgi:trehalose 6-phosphate phosphatase